VNTPFDFNEYQRTTKRSDRTRWRSSVLPPIKCADGFHFSVQASEFHYCNPRFDGMHEYETVEVGFPSERVELLMPWCEDPSCPTETVYGRVPVEVVNAIVAEHGGVAE